MVLNCFRDKPILNTLQSNKRELTKFNVACVLPLTTNNTAKINEYRENQ